MFECVSAKAISSDRWEEGAEAFLAITDPTLDEFGRIAPQRRSAVFSAFAQTFDKGTGRKHHIIAVQVDQF